LVAVLGRKALSEMAGFFREKQGMNCEDQKRRKTKRHNARKEVFDLKKTVYVFPCFPNARIPKIKAGSRCIMHL